MKTDNRGIWIGAVALIVLAALVLWWVSASQPLDSSTDIANGNATSTSAGDTSNTTKKPTVTRVSQSKRDVVSIVNSLQGVSTFKAQFAASGVASSISPTGKYTIFVPTNGAFAQLPAGTISSMSAAEKKRMVQYHIVAGRAIDVDALAAGNIEAMSKDVLNFSFGPTKIPMVNSAIIIQQYDGKNGTVYLIDNVLLPPKR